MRILVTGGAGFLGSALSNALAADTHEVIVLADLSMGDPQRLDSRVLFNRGSISNRPKVWSLLQGVQCVYHLAARVLVAESVLYPREYNEVNVSGTLALLEAVRDVGVPRFIFTSSGAVYGDQDKHPVDETATPKPRSPYAVSKLSAEQYVHTIGALWGIETIALRIFNAYGPGQPVLAAHSPVIPRFIHQAQGQGSLVIFGTGNQSRDMVYVDDVVNALKAVLTAPATIPHTINIGSGTETSINTLADLILSITNSSSNIIYSPVQNEGLLRLCADISLARQFLGYNPQYALTDGLKRMLKTDPRFNQT
ncbi:MAG: NAD-dependent epimerase/dehydratase family protein [Anaerolineales bacterium]|nr:MAG: NAD-dependent epimerase/dehydratase family protein [Anaerolineales bacterium]